jgi:hypothetical protein
VMGFVSENPTSIIKERRLVCHNFYVELYLAFFLVLVIGHGNSTGNLIY